MGSRTDWKLFERLLAGQCISLHQPAQVRMHRFLMGTGIRKKVRISLPSDCEASMPSFRGHQFAGLGHQRWAGHLPYRRLDGVQRPLMACAMAWVLARIMAT